MLVKDGHKIWTDYERNYKELQSQRGEEYLQSIKRRKLKESRNCVLKRVIKGKVERRIKVIGRRGRRHKQVPHDIKGKRRGY